MDDKYVMPLICIRCRKPIPLTYGTMKEISYTHYSYCEECLRKGLKALRMWGEQTEPKFDKDINVRSKTEPQTDCPWK